MPAPSDSYGQVVYADSPTVWLRGDGSTADYMGGSSGTLNGGATYATSPIPARPAAQAFSFDGVDSDVTVPDQPQLDPTGSGFTIEAWVLPNALQASATFFARAEWWLAQGSSGLFSFGAYAGGASYAEAFVNTAYTPGTLYHLVGIYDGTDVRLFINGSLAATTAKTGAPNSGTGGLFVGSWTNGTDWFDGKVAECAFYDSVLTSTQVADHYAAGLVVSKALSDTGGGTDALAIHTTKTLADTASGTDTLAIRIAKTLSDTGAGVDQLTAATTPKPHVPGVATLTAAVGDATLTATATAGATLTAAVGDATLTAASGSAVIATT